jgi:hypothetical protein
MSIEINVINEIVQIDETSEVVQINASGGIGVPSGGLTNQFLAKNSNTNYDFKWANVLWGQVSGTLSDQTDLQNALNLKVPTSRTLTINGISFDLSANRTWTFNSDNIYTANGTLTSARTLTQGGFNLDFIGSIYTNRFTSAGRLLIGNGAESTYPLDVNGSARITSNLFLNLDTYITASDDIGNRPRITFGTTGIFDKNWTFVPNTSGGILVANAYGTISSLSAIFEIASNTRGFLPPRMTSAERTGITSPATGLLVYQTDGTEGLYEKTASAWRIINGGGGGSMAIGGAITSATAGSVLFAGTSGVLQQDNANLFWDDTNNRLGIGTATPSATFHSVGSVTASSANARGNYLQPTLIASANSDVLVALDIAPTFTIGGFSAISPCGLRLQSSTTNLFEGILIRNTLNSTLNQSRIKFDNENTILPASGGVIFFTGNSYTGFPANSFGFWNHTSNGIIALATNNTERLRLTAAGRLLIGTTSESTFILDVNGTARVSDALTISKNQNAATDVIVSNTTSGTASMTRVRVISSGAGPEGSLFSTSAGYTAYGAIVANSVGLYTNAAAGLVLVTENNNIKFATGAGAGNSVKATITNAGRLLLGTTTEGTNILEVNGNISATSMSRNVTNNFITLFGGTTFQTGAYFQMTGSTYGTDPGASSASFVIGNLSTSAFELVTYDAVSTYTRRLKLFGNTGNILIGSGSNVTSSIFQISSTTQGFLPPRMTTTQKNAISSPAAGLMVFDTTLVKLCVYSGTAWETITSV